jgi:hypothetical protein
VVKAVPYRIHTVLTDNGIQFRPPPRYDDGPTARFANHMFGMRCRESDIEHITITVTLNSSDTSMTSSMPTISAVA